MRFSLLLFVLLALGCSQPRVQPELPALIPYPQEVTEGVGIFTINEHTALSVDPLFASELHHLQLAVSESTGWNLVVGSMAQPMISLVFNESLPEEGYRLEVSDAGVVISASTATGAFYGIQTFRQFLPMQMGSSSVDLPFVTITDQPAFQHRGMLFDCCRHYMEPDFVKRYIDLLARFKMNVLHWHLTEDQGWRIEIDAYPQLTAVGAWRTEADGSRYGGYYTKEQIRDIVAYAAERHITVIPEIEMPGHSSAAIAAYPWLGCTGDSIEVETEWGVFKDIYCAGNDSTLAFLETVLDEVMELFPSEIIHLGGDEAPKARWEECSKCQKRIADHHLRDAHELQSFFIEHFANYLKAHGRKAIGWDEILEGGLPDGAMVQSWRGMEGGIAAAAAGRDVVMSPTSHAYFDYDVKSTDLSEVYHFVPASDTLDADIAKHIIGGECNMWTEHAPQEKVDARMFPRMLAMSEVLWTNHKVRNFDAFHNRVEEMYAYLDFLGVNYGPESVPFTYTVSTKDSGLEVIFNRINPKLKLTSVNGTEFASDTLLVTDIYIDTITAVKNDRPYGDPVSIALENHVGVNAPIILPNGYSAYYTGGGEHALNDGVKGSFDFRDGRWQALQGKDMVVQIDLLEVKEIISLNTQFYTYANAWIFMPLEVLAETSENGTDWRRFDPIKNPLAEDDKRQEILPVVVPCAGKARYVRMTAVNRGVCPDWHDAPGEPSWLFCDEVVIRTVR